MLMQPYAVNAKIIISSWLHTFLWIFCDISLGILSVSILYLQNTDANMKKKCQLFECVMCSFICSKKSNYMKHMDTEKHKILTENARTSKEYICTCGKIYKHRQSLHTHKLICLDNDYIHHSIEPSLIVDLIKQNNEFKQMMIEQTNQMLEIAKNTQVINNHTTNNNNQKFNLNFFLNDTCKDAMSITDFLRNMNVHNDELEYIGNHGYVSGMTKMIMDRLKDMDVTKRPIHCTDIKRETMYIKDDTGWSKDTDELTKLRKILGRISMNNYRAVPDWRTAHPDCEVMDTRNYEFCYKMMRAILGDVEDEQIKLDNKIIKTMAKELFVKK